MAVGGHGMACMAFVYPSVLGLCSGSIKKYNLLIYYFVCLSVLRFNDLVNNFSVISGRRHRFLCITSTFGGVKCFAQGHPTAEVGLEPPTCTVTAQLISAFVFAIRIVQSLYYLTPKFQASNHIVWL